MEIQSVQSGMANAGGREVVASFTGAPIRSGEVQSALTSNPVQPVQKPVDPEALKQAAEKINKTIQSMATNLQFTVDDDLQMPIVRVMDSSTKEVIRQIPTEEVVAIAKALDKLQGLIIRQKA